jgi:hypothetical protein
MPIHRAVWDSPLPDWSTELNDEATSPLLMPTRLPPDSVQNGTPPAHGNSPVSTSLRPEVVIQQVRDVIRILARRDLESLSADGVERKALVRLEVAHIDALAIEVEATPQGIAVHLVTNDEAARAFLLENEAVLRLILTKEANGSGTSFEPLVEMPNAARASLALKNTETQLTDAGMTGQEADARKDNGSTSNGSGQGGSGQQHSQGQGHESASTPVPDGSQRHAGRPSVDAIAIFRLSLGMLPRQAQA